MPGKLPVQPSPDLMAAMQRLASSLHSLGADTVTAQPSIAEDVLATMLVDLASRYSKRAEAWRGENRDETSVNRGVQELWDLDFLRTVWKSAVPDESNSQAKVGQAVDSTIADVQKLVSQVWDDRMMVHSH